MHYCLPMKVFVMCDEQISPAEACILGIHVHVENCTFPTSDGEEVTSFSTQLKAVRHVLNEKTLSAEEYIDFSLLARLTCQKTS